MTLHCACFMGIGCYTGVQLVDYSPVGRISVFSYLNAKYLTSSIEKKNKKKIA